MLLSPTNGGENIYTNIHKKQLLYWELMPSGMGPKIYVYRKEPLIPLVGGSGESG